MGGKPQKNTPADQRLKVNNPNVGKKVAPKIIKPMPVKKVGK